MGSIDHFALADSALLARLDETGPDETDDETPTEKEGR